MDGRNRRKENRVTALMFDGEWRLPRATYYLILGLLALMVGIIVFGLAMALSGNGDSNSTLVISGAVCGDGTCEGSETEANCSIDCAVPEAPGPDCGKNPGTFNAIGGHYERKYNRWCEAFTGDPLEGLCHDQWANECISF